MAQNLNLDANGRKPFVKPELHELKITGTASGPFPDPSEFPMILQMS